MAKNITFKREDFTEYAWNVLLDKFGISEKERENWIDSIEISIGDDPTSITYANTKYSIAEVKALAERYYKNCYTDAEYIWDAWYLTYGNSRKRYTDAELEKLEQWLDEREGTKWTTS